MKKMSQIDNECSLVYLILTTYFKGTVLKDLAREFAGPFLYDGLI